MAMYSYIDFNWTIPNMYVNPTCFVIFQELYNHLPQQRQLPKSAKDKATGLLMMNANRKLVQQQMSQEPGKIILLKDLSNLTTRAKQTNSKNDLDGCIKKLMEKYGKHKIMYVQMYRI